MNRIQDLITQILKFLFEMKQVFGEQIGKDGPLARAPVPVNQNRSKIDVFAHQRVNDIFHLLDLFINDDAQQDPRFLDAEHVDESVQQIPIGNDAYQTQVLINHRKGSHPRFFDELHREFGAVSHTSDDMLRPLAVECESVAGESDGAPTAACDGFVLRAGSRLPPSSRHRVRLKDVISLPVTLEIFGEPGVPWQVEGQNLEGKILFHRFVKLDDSGSGTMGLPQNRNLIRLFLSPTRKSDLKEVVVWGRPNPNE